MRVVFNRVFAKRFSPTKLFGDTRSIIIGLNPIYLMISGFTFRISLRDTKHVCRSATVSEYALLRRKLRELIDKDTKQNNTNLISG
jgi:hypothetical protein